MNGRDDSRRGRPDRPENPPQSPPGAEDPGHAIPFGEGVYGLGGRRPAPDPRNEMPPHGDPLRPGATAAGGEGDQVRDPDFDFRRLASELGFENHREDQECVGWCPLCRTADVLRAVTTPELRTAWLEFQHELARALRGAAERYASSAPPEPGDRVTEIPID